MSCPQESVKAHDPCELTPKNWLFASHGIRFSRELRGMQRYASECEGKFRPFSAVRSPQIIASKLTLVTGYGRLDIGRPHAPTSAAAECI